MSPFDLEVQLQQHGSALRRLAHDLVRDHSAADDLVQETLQCALDRPPALPGPLGGWLATVLRRLHLQRRRRELRRNQRERIAARPELTASTIDQVERKDTLRTVTTAVFALEEPYQTTLLLRYFENLTPAQIAQRTDTNITTVKSRLQRGVLLLRGRLDRALGDRDRWQRALCAATGLKLLTTTTILCTGALLMGPTTKFALGGAAALLLGALVWTMLNNEPGPVQPAAAADKVAAGAAAVASDTTAAPAPTDRVAMHEQAPIDDVLLHPFAYDLEVQVQDRLGLPMADAKVLLAPLGCTLDEVAERTDAAGIVHVHWRGRSAAMQVVIATGNDETRDAMRQIMVQSGAVNRVVLGGGSPQRGQLRLVSSSNGSFTLDFAAKDAGGQNGTIKLDGIVLQADSFANNPQMRDGLHPFASFADLQLREPVQAGPELAISTLSGLTFNLTNSITAVQLDQAKDATAPLPTRIEGIVYGEDGKPCAKCPVAWGHSVDRADERTETDARGAFHFDNLPAGKLELRAGGNDAGLQHMTVAVMQGQTSTTEIQLRHEITVRGHAIGADGKPLAGWRVEWVGTQTPWFDACTTAEDGSFVLPNLPGGTGRVLLWHKNGNVHLPMAQLPDVLPDNGDTELRFDAEVSSGRLQCEPLLPDGIDKGAVEVRIFQEDSGRGTTMHQVKDSNAFAVRNLAAGWYRLEVGGPGLGWLDAGRHYVDGKSLVDLGRLPLNAPGTVRLQLPAGVKLAKPAEGGAALEIYRRRPDCDVRLEDTAAGLGDALPLPPGDYFAMWRTATGAQGFTPFTVQTGRDIAVQCMDRDVQAWHADDAGAARERR